MSYFNSVSKEFLYPLQTNSYNILHYHWARCFCFIDTHLENIFQSVIESRTYVKCKSGSEGWNCFNRQMQQKQYRNRMSSMLEAIVVHAQWFHILYATTLDEELWAEMRPGILDTWWRILRSKTTLDETTINPSRRTSRWTLYMSGFQQVTVGEC